MNVFIMLRAALKALCIAALSLLCFACANSDPEIVSVTGTVVFDFADEKSAPKTRLAFFMQTDTEVQRADFIEAVHRESGMRWTVESPRLISGSDKHWAGYTNLQPGAGDEIFTGVYDCFYYDAAGNEVSSTFAIEYPAALLTATAENANDCFESSVVEYIALYTESGELSFFNKRRNSWRKNSDIVKDYRDAYTMRRCLVANNNGIVCLLPPEALLEKKEPVVEDE